MSVVSVHHIESYFLPDTFNKLLKFFENNPLGLKLENIEENKQMKIRVASLHLPADKEGIMIGLISPSDTSSNIYRQFQDGHYTDGVIDHIGLRVKNIEEVLRKLKESGMASTVMGKPIGIMLGPKGIRQLPHPSISKEHLSLRTHLLAIECPKCGTQLNEGQKYCHECGEKIILL